MFGFGNKPKKIADGCLLVIKPTLDSLKRVYGVTDNALEHDVFLINYLIGFVEGSMRLVGITSMKDREMIMVLFLSEIFPNSLHEVMQHNDKVVEAGSKIADEALNIGIKEAMNIAANNKSGMPLPSFQKHIADKYR